jgi:hypothetical protein
MTNSPTGRRTVMSDLYLLENITWLNRNIGDTHIKRFFA